MYAHAQPGDTVYLRAGTYPGDHINGDGYCSVDRLPEPRLMGGAPGAYITIAPYDGTYSVIFTGGLMIVRGKYLRVEGIDFTPATTVGSATHVIQLTSGCNDYYTPDKRGNHIEIRNCRFHDWQAPGHYGCVKVNQVDYITLQDCELGTTSTEQNPSHTPASSSIRMPGLRRGPTIRIWSPGTSPLFRLKMATTWTFTAALVTAT